MVAAALGACVEPPRAKPAPAEPVEDTSADDSGSAVVVLPTDEICDNGLDDDLDGAIDCDDSDCGRECREDCDSGLDEDGDGLVDCADPDCAEFCPEDCFNGEDDDFDRLVDCDDPDCSSRCLENCFNGEDDDADGWIDCIDPECADACPEDCFNGEDDDYDGLIDCLDPECEGVCVEDCHSEGDEDLDGAADCFDADCAGVCPEDCDNGFDDDWDGLLDCEDADCIGLPVCDEACGDGVDNDRDGLMDCADDDCWASCATVTLTVTGGDAGWSTRRRDRRQYVASFVGRTSTTSASAMTTSFPLLSGTIHVQTGHGAVNSCQFFAHSARVVGTQSWHRIPRTTWSRPTTSSASSFGFSVGAVSSTGACTLSPARFLPTRLALPRLGTHTGSVFPADVRVGRSIVQASWLRWTVGSAPVSSSPGPYASTTGWWSGSSAAWWAYSSAVQPQPGQAMTLSSVVLP